MGIDRESDSQIDLGRLLGDTQKIMIALRRHLPELKSKQRVDNIQIFGSFLRGGRKSA
jgi:predicted nucleotidyltransferase